MIVRLAAVAAAALALAGPAAAACSQPRTSLTYLEGQIMCPTCHTTLDQSDAPAAQSIKAYIQKRVGECATANQIEGELVANFGAGILAAPTHKGFDLLAWWLPIGGVLLGAALLAIGVWRWSRTHEPDGPPGGPPSPNGKPQPELDAETEQRLDELLARLD
ncbi:MAG TPA: cytochrome c-type biogenesis protein CcmH [Gaiellaceae bacterium]